ncbi:MAG: uracil-DNA glycosylase [Steroidobacterales bacterium]
MSARDQYLEALGIDVWTSRARRPPAREAIDPDETAEPIASAVTPAAAAALVAAAPVLAAPVLAAPVVAAPGITPVDETAWRALRAQVSVCTRCELSKTRTQTVFGVGNPRAEIMVIGEAPGADEDRQGEPFVGRAGQLLNSMLRAIGHPRETVYIANVLKCRPPGNREPRPAEAACCLPYLQQQLDMIQPRLLVALGRVAAQNLLATDTPLARLRGQLHRIGARATPLIVTYHPAYLLRSPTEKRKSWLDLKFIRAELARARAGA